MLERLIVALSLAGLILSLYFTFAYYGRVRKWRWIPAILCPREGASCLTVLRTPYARVLGVPNSVLGILYYLLVIAGALIGFNGPSRYEGGYPWVWPARFVLAASVATVLLGCYLIYALRRKLRVHCPLCYVAHAINTALLVLWLLVAW